MAGANPFLEPTAGRLLAHVGAWFLDRDARAATDVRSAYAKLASGCERLACGLLALGVGKDDKVAQGLQNRLVRLITSYACAMIGAIVVGLNTRYKAHELSYPGSPGWISSYSPVVALNCVDHPAAEKGTYRCGERLG